MIVFISRISKESCKYPFVPFGFSLLNGQAYVSTKSYVSLIRNGLFQRSKNFTYLRGNIVQWKQKHQRLHVSLAMGLSSSPSPKSLVGFPNGEGFTAGEATTMVTTPGTLRTAKVVYSAPMDIRRKRPVMEVRKNKATMLRKQRLGCGPMAWPDGAGVAAGSRQGFVVGVQGCDPQWELTRSSQGLPKAE